MIVLDTNVVSELMRPTPEPAVEEWMSSRAGTTLFLTAISEAELRYGIAIMASGKRRDALKSEIEGILNEDFAGRLLPFDSRAASAYGQIAANCRASGHSVSQSDVQIAAIAQSRGMAVATRNTRDFVSMGVDLINPWTDA